MIGIAREPSTAFEFQMDDSGRWQPRAPVTEVSRQLAAELNRHTARILADEYGPAKGERFHFGFLRIVEVLGLELLAFIPPTSPNEEIVY